MVDSDQSNPKVKLHYQYGWSSLLFLWEIYIIKVSL